MLQHYRHISKTLQLSTIIALLTISGCNFGPYQTKQVESEAIFLKDSLEENQVVKDYISPYKDSLDSKMNQIIGHSARKMDKGIPESLLTNFVADLILKESRDLAIANEAIPLPDIALINHKGLRTIIDQGAISQRNIYQLMPFENEIVLVTLNKEQTLELLNYIASVGGDGISGARFTIKDDKAIDITINNNPLQKDNYVVATSDYVAKGGDSYFVFTKGQTIGTNVKFRDMILHHIQNLEANNLKADAELDKRIKL